MSEHISIKSKCNYIHLPYDDEGGFTYCHFCKKTMDKAEIILHNGISSDWMQLNCGYCKRTIWTSRIKRKKEVLNKKCYICKNPCSYHNSYCVSSCGLINKGRTIYLCSRKCNNKHDKLLDNQRRNIKR